MCVILKTDLWFFFVVDLSSIKTLDILLTEKWSSEKDFIWLKWMNGNLFFKLAVSKTSITPQNTNYENPALSPSSNWPPDFQPALRFLVIGDWWFTQKRVFTFFLVIGDSPGDSPDDWWFTFFGFSVSITNCKSPEKKVGSLLTLIISNCQSSKMFCLFFTVNSHLSIANFFII